MPDLEPDSNIRFPDWTTGTSYKKHDSRFYQRSFVDTSNSILPFSGVAPAWTSAGNENHAHDILTSNFIKSKGGESAPSQSDLEVESKDTAGASFSTFNGNFGLLTIDTSSTDTFVKKFFIAKNNNTDPQSFGLNYDYYIHSYKIVGSGRKHFSIYKGNQHKGEFIKFDQPVRIKPSKFGSDDLELRFHQGELSDNCENFSVSAQLKVTYKNDSGQTLTLLKNLSGKLTINAQEFETVTLIAMSNELARMQDSNKFEGQYQHLNVLASDPHDPALNQFMSNLDAEDYAKLLNFNGFYQNFSANNSELGQVIFNYVPFDQGPECVKLINDHRAGAYNSEFEKNSGKKDISIGRHAASLNFPLLRDSDKSFFKQKPAANISNYSSRDKSILTVQTNWQEDLHVNDSSVEPSWMTKNFDKLISQLSPHWHSDKWPTIAPDFEVLGSPSPDNSRPRTNKEREGSRQAQISITNKPTDNYPFSSSGEFVCESSPPNAWGFLANTENNYKIYHNMATGWSADASADNRTDSIIIEDRHGDWFDIPQHLDNSIYNGISINSTRTWNEYEDTWVTPKNNPFFGSTNQISQSSIVTYPNEIKSVGLASTLDPKGQSNEFVMKAIPSGKAAGEAEFGSSHVYKLFDFYYGLSHPDSIFNTNASKPRPWLPYATFPPYIRTKMPESSNANAGVNGSPDIIQGTISYTDTDGNIKNVNWETNFAHAFVPLKRNTDLPKHYRKSRFENNIELPNDLADDGTPDQQGLIVHTNIALLHISVPK